MTRCDLYDLMRITKTLYEPQPLQKHSCLTSLVSQAKLSWSLTKEEKLSASISKAKEINEKTNTEGINDMPWKIVPGIDCCSKARSACDIQLSKVLLDPKVVL